VDLVYSVTVGAHGYVAVTLFQKSGPMDAAGIFVVDLLVTGPAPLRYPASWLVGACDIVGAMAVSAGGSLLAALCQHGVVHAVQRLGVVLEVAAPAHLVVAEYVVPVIGDLKRGVWVAGLSRVAGIATEPTPVDRFLERLRVNVQRKPLSAGKGDAQIWVGVAVQASRRWLARGLCPALRTEPYHRRPESACR